MRKPYEETCGDSGEEELTFKIESPLAETDSGAC